MRSSARVLFVAGALSLLPAAGLMGSSVASASGPPVSLTVTGGADGTGSCAVSGLAGTCTTLRAAVIYADGNNGSASFVVTLPAGYYSLTVVPDGSNDLTSGSLKVTSGTNLTLEGGGASDTLVEAGGTLGDDIFSVASGGTLTLQNLTIDGGHQPPSTGDQSGAGDIYNDGTLTIDGATVSGGVASGAGGGDVYNDTSGSLVIGDGSRITAGDAIKTDGGGLYNLGSATIGNTTFEGDSAGGNGGAIADNGQIQLESGTVLSGNSAQNLGGGLYVSPSVASAVSISGTTIEGNMAYGGGGGLSNEAGASAPVVVSNSTISGNSADYPGGGIHNDGYLTLESTAVSGNSASSNSGGGIWNSNTVSVTGGQISGNSAGADGGGLFNGSVGLAQLSDTTVSGNSAAVDGGGVYNISGLEDGLQITGSTVQGNSALQYGGGLLNDGGPRLNIKRQSVGSASVAGSTFSDNSAPDGSAILNYGYLVAENSTVARNLTTGSGAAVENQTTTNGEAIAELSFLTIADNPGPSGSMNLSNNFGQVDLASSVLAYAPGTQCGGSSLYPVTDHGGNVASDSSCAFSATGSVNGADPQLLPLAANGGTGLPETMAIFSTASHPSPAVNTTVASSCLDVSGSAVTTDENGNPRPSTVGASTGCDAGAYQLQSYSAAPTAAATGPVTLTVNQYTDDSGSDSGSNCSVTGGSGSCPTLRDAIDYANGASSAVTVDLSAGEYVFDAAASVGSGADLTIAGAGQSSTVIEEAAAVPGATVLGVQPSGQLNLQDLTVDGGNGNSGGDVYNNGTLNLSNVGVTGGSALEYGGGIYNDAKGTLTVTNGSLLDGNSSPLEGGDLANYGTASITNSTLSGGWAGAGGGGIANKGGLLTVTGGLVTDDSSAGYGGGVEDVGGATTKVTGTQFTGDTAAYGGGAIVNSGALSGLSQLTLSAVTITGSSVPTSGDGLGGGGLENSGIAAVTGSTLSGDNAVSGGGGIAADSGLLTVTTSTFSGDSTCWDGGAIGSRFGTVLISDSTFTGDSASCGEGGALFNDSSSSGTSFGMQVVASTLEGNSSALNGGAIENDGLMPVVGSTILDNSAVAGNGGGILNQGELELLNSTLDGNSTGLGSGTALFDGALVSGLSHLSSLVTASYDTLVSNPGPDGSETFYVNPSRPTAEAVLAASILGYGPGQQCGGARVFGTGDVATDASCGSVAATADPEMLPLSQVVAGSPGVAPILPSSPAGNVFTGASCLDPAHFGHFVAVDEISQTRPSVIGTTAGCDAGAYQLPQQAPLSLTSTTGTYGSPLPLDVSGGTTNGAVTYEVDAGGTTTCSVIDSGTELQASSSGTCYVTATMAGDIRYPIISSPSTLITFLRAAQAPLTITSTSGSYGRPLGLTTSGGSGTGAVSYVLDDAGTAGCYVSGDTLGAASTGTCTVTATKSGDVNYLPISSAPTVITIGKGDQAGLYITSVSGAPELPLPLQVVGGSDGGAVSYVLDDPGTAGCSLSGSSLLAASEGTCTVTATMAGNADYLPVSSPVTTIWFAKVNQAPLSITSVKGTYGVPLSVKTSGGSTGGAVSYAIDLLGTARCNVINGILSSAHAGTCVVTAAMAGNASYNPVSSSPTTITIAPAPTKVVLRLSKQKVVFGHESLESLRVTVSARGEVPSGSVTIAGTSCQMVLRGGSASCTLSNKALAVGKHFLVAEYQGSSDFLASHSATKTLVVKKAPKPKPLAAAAAAATLHWVGTTGWW